MDKSIPFLSHGQILQDGTQLLYNVIQQNHTNSIYAAHNVRDLSIHIGALSNNNLQAIEFQIQSSRNTKLSISYPASLCLAFFSTGDSIMVKSSNNQHGVFLPFQCNVVKLDNLECELVIKKDRNYRLSLFIFESEFLDLWFPHFIDVYSNSNCLISSAMATRLDYIFMERVTSLPDDYLEAYTLFLLRKIRKHESLPLSLSELMEVQSGRLCITKNLPSAILAKVLSRSIHMEYERFEFCFKLVYGMTTSEFIRLERINQAQWYLRYSSLELSRISSLLGFKDTTEFSICFSREMECGPLNYRYNYSSMFNSN